MANNVRVLGIDQSTQGTKALLLDEKGQIIDKEVISHRQIINDKGYVEHDLNEISGNVIKAVKALVDRDEDHGKNIVTVGLSVQRETVCAYQRSTLRPLYNAIVWQCPRGRDFVQRAEIASYRDRIKKITGLELSEFFSAPKATWLIDNVPEVGELAIKNDLCIGNIDTFLISFLTEGKSFYTEPSNASRTMLMDINTLTWSDELLKLFKIPKNALATIVDSDSNFGQTDFKGVLPHKIPILCAIGDSQGALFGQGAISAGQIKTTYGTGSSIMLNCGHQAVECQKGIVTSVGWRRGGEVTYVLEGNINYSAGVITWLKDDLKLISDPKETSELAFSANPQDVTYLVPAFSGLGAPYFTGDVRGILVGMSRVTTRNEIVRAALDSIVYQVADVIELIKQSSPYALTCVNVDGGATGNEYLMQTQSNIVNLPIKVAKDAELSGMGAAFMAGIKKGVYDLNIFTGDRVKKSYEPHMDLDLVKDKLDKWHKAVKTALYQGL